MEKYLASIAVLAYLPIFIWTFIRHSTQKALKGIILGIIDAAYVVILIKYPLEDSLNLYINIAVIALLNVLIIIRLISKPKANQEELNRMHDDPNNWKWGVFYYNPSDKRIFPPKRIESMGWTVNFANPYSVMVLVLVILFAMALPFFLSMAK